MAKAISPNCKIKVVGIRPGEKLHEEMITVDASINTIENSKYYIILPVLENKYQKIYLKKYKANKVKKRFSYNSFDNNKFLNISEIRNAIKKNLKSDFKPI